MIKLLILFSLLAGAAVAQMVPWQPFVLNPQSGSACSNELDFSQSCNSQYLVVVH